VSTAENFAARRLRILAYFREHGGQATAKQFGISKQRVYQLLGKMMGKKPRRR